MSAFIFSTVYEEHLKIEIEIKRSFLSFARTSTLVLAEVFLNRDEDLLGRYVSRVGSEYNIRYVLIQDSEGRTLSIIGGGHDTLSSDDEMARRVADGSELVREVGRPPLDFLHRSGHTFEAMAPITSGGRSLGIVRVGFSSRAMNERIVAIMNKGMLSASLAMLVGTLVAVLISWQMTRPLSSLVGGTKRMAEGDLSQRVDIKSSDELKALGDAFNQMAQKLGELYSSLERQVEERTAELSESKRKLEGLFNSIADLITVQDKEYRIVMANRAVFGLLKRSPQEVIGRKCYEVYHNRNAPCENCPVSKTIQTKGPAFSESQYRDEVLHRYTHPVLDEDGQLESIVQFGRVVTKEKVLERQLIQSAKLASLGELAASIAHEVRNPLASISASAQVLRRKLERDTEKTEFTEMILLESRHLEELVNNLLDFARPSKSELKMVPLNDLLEETVSLIVRQIEKQRVELVRSYDPGRPAAEIDERQIKQALLNVLINALQAMPEGGRLRVETASTEREVSITVADTGPGIPAESVEKIFQPFFSTKHQGAGLGLSIVKRIIEEHDGSISVENSGGAVFTVSLPRLRAKGISSI